MGILPGSAQEYRSFDGTGNNLQQSDWGAAGAPLARKTTVDYGDGISLPGGASRPNPRLISNTLFAQDSLINDALKLSDFVWVFGQFIDHDITLVENNTETANIQVPIGDPWFDPFNTGIAFIGMNRSEVLAGTGTSFANPRQHPNRITAFLDASGVYGSDLDRANWLRTFSDGKLKTSAGNNLPFNTLDGELESEIDPTAPHMADDVGMSPKLFVAGDVRANENLLLIGMHTLFVREHNRLCDELILANPTWTDEMLYQHARRLVIGMLQAIVYEEWLPAMGVHVPDYAGYDATQNPNIFNVFSASAFRLGHTLLNSNIQRMDNEGNMIPQGDIGLLSAFFNPLEFIDGGGMDPLFKGMAAKIQQEMDAKVIDDVRNFLFGPPGAGGLDLAAININRGRERGIPDFNKVREDFGLTPYTTISELCSNPEAVAALTTLYGDVDDIDSWVGMLAEDHMSDALFGPTIMKIMEEQFKIIRDGDRFYYEVDAGLSTEEKAMIKQTTMHDLVMHNTGITLMQEKVFEAMPHDSIPANILVSVETANSVGIPSVALDITSSDPGNIAGGLTNDNGIFRFTNLPTMHEYTITPTKSSTAASGIGLSDMLILRKHLLSLDFLDSPYEYIAADVNMQDGFTILDMIEIQKVILNITSDFPSNQTWRFVDAGYNFTNLNDPLSESFPESVVVAPGATSAANFVAVKLGDIDNSADPNNLLSSEVRGFAGTLNFEVDDATLVAGERYELAFRSADLADMEGYQFTLGYDTEKLAFRELKTGALAGLTKDNFGIFEAAGAITTIWYGEADDVEDEVLFTIVFEVQENAKLSDIISINSRLTQKEAYNKQSEAMDIALNFQSKEAAIATTERNFKLYQNQPNPFTETTMIGFELPTAGQATLRIFDLAGRAVLNRTQYFEKGYQQIELDRSSIATDGVLYYQLQTETGTKTKKMVLLRTSRP